MEIVTRERTEPELIPSPVPIKGKGGFRPGAGRKPNPTPKPPKGEVFVLPKLPFNRGVNRFQEMVKWWLTLTDEQLNVLIIYVYRGWPVCDVKSINPDADAYIDKMTGPCPFTEADWKQEVLGRYGSGSFTFLVKEGNVQRWTVYINDLVDLANHPPLIDYRTLMLSAPANKDFVKWARSRNMIEQDNAEGAGMANAAIEQMANTQERMADRLMDMADRVAAAKESGGGVEAQTQSRLVEMVIDASTRANSVALDMVKQNASTKDQQANPLELIDRIVSVAGALNGGNKGDSAVLTLMQQMVSAAEKRADRLEEELHELRRNKERNGEDEEKGLLGSLEKLKGLKDLFVDLGLVKGDAAESAATDAAAKSGSLKSMLLERAISALPGMIGEGGINGLLSSFAQVIAAAKMQPMQATAAAPAAVAGVQPMNAVPQPNPMPAAAPAPRGPIVVMGWPMPATTGVKELDEVMLIVWRISETLVHHMNTDGLDGHTFARWFVDSSPTGRQTYDLMVHAEEEKAGTLEELLQKYQPLWSKLNVALPGSAPDTSKLKKFLGEFCELDKWEAEGADDGEDDEPEVPAKPVTGKVVK